MKGSRDRLPRAEVDRRLERARHYFREHHAGVEPQADFADRVASRLRREPAEELGWAALRLLPASLAVVALLAWFSLQATPVAEPVTTPAPTEDLIGWVLDDLESSP